MAHPVTRQGAPRVPTSTRRFTIRAAAAMLVATVAGVTFGMWLSTTSVLEVKSGAASQITLDHNPTGVWRLMVSTNARYLSSSGPVRYVDANPHLDGPVTTDQAASSQIGWEAACAAVWRLELIETPLAQRCIDGDRPNVGYAEASRGASADLAEALSVATLAGDLTGDAQVAGTATIIEVHDQDGQLIDHELGGIGGIEHKAAAAAAAGIDILIVSATDHDAFATNADIVGANITVLGAPNVTTAIWQLCDQTRTEHCKATILTVE